MELVFAENCFLQVLQRNGIVGCFALSLMLSLSQYAQ